jgi:hypothetical protein
MNVLKGNSPAHRRGSHAMLVTGSQSTTGKRRQRTTPPILPNFTRPRTTRGDGLLVQRTNQVRADLLTALRVHRGTLAQSTAQASDATIVRGDQVRHVVVSDTSSTRRARWTDQGALANIRPRRPPGTWFGV